MASLERVRELFHEFCDELLEWSYENGKSELCMVLADEDTFTELEGCSIRVLHDVGQEPAEMEEVVRF